MWRVRIDIFAIGSRGDVQPYVALGAGLQQAGYKVRIVALGGFEDLVRANGLDYFCLGASPKEITNTTAGRDWIEQRDSTGGFLRGFVRIAGELIETGISTYWRVCGDTEALITSPMGLLVAIHIRERLQVPLLQAHLAPPVLRTRYDWDGRKTLKTAVAGQLNVSVHTLFHFLIWSSLRRSINSARTKILGLPALSLTAPLKTAMRERYPLLAGYSPAVVQRVPDWGDWLHVTGYWFLEDAPGWTPSRPLTDFLESGPPPVFVGFGSTPFPQPETTTHLIVRALERSNQRGLLLAGGSGLTTGQLNKNVLSIDSAPHGWLFSRVCAAVHHGGAGVTGAALRAGLPSVVVPVFADQPFWGKRVSKLGAGPPSIPAKSLTEDNLTAAIQATESAQIREQAAAIGKRIRAENGVACAVRIIQEHLRQRPGHHAY